jgi:hypothetical protein
MGVIQGVPGSIMGSADSSLRSPLTVREVMQQLCRGTCLVPEAHEGDLALSPSQIIALFDFLMQEHGIGTFLFWSLEKSKIGNYHFYNLNMDQEKKRQQMLEDEQNKDDYVTVVLDGRRRLTSLYAGLKGNNGSGIQWGTENGRVNAEDRVLYLNILAEPQRPGEAYEFRFLTLREATKRDQKTHWFDVGRVLDFDGAEDIARYLDENDLAGEEIARRVVCRLYQAVNESGVIRYYLETSEELGDVFMKFV